jgi:hypothetical protein
MTATIAANLTMVGEAAAMSRPRPRVRLKAVAVVSGDSLNSPSTWTWDLGHFATKSAK